jgi:hypothetical protein
MNKLLAGDLRGLNLPRDLAILRRDAESALGKGASLDSLYGALAAEHPIALGELVYGPKALTGESAVRSALKVVEVLEKGLQPKALYPRLAKLGDTAAPEVLEAAVNRFPGAPWVMKLGDKLDLVPGLMHLEGLLGHDGFETACFAHARNGHFKALLTMASKGQPEPAAALLSVGACAEAAQAANAALDQLPDAHVVAWLAAVGGLDLDDFLCGLLPQLKSKRAVELLLARTTPFTKTNARLRILLPAVR